MERNTDEKKPYVSPQLTVHGDVEVITLGTQNGNNLDRAFPNNTPRGDLTFS